MINELGQNSASFTAFWGEPTVTLPGSWGAAHLDELAPRAGEPVITKYAYGVLRRHQPGHDAAQPGDRHPGDGRDRRSTSAWATPCTTPSPSATTWSAWRTACPASPSATARHAEQLKEDCLYLIENHYGVGVPLRRDHRDHFAQEVSAMADNRPFDIDLSRAAFIVVDMQNDFVRAGRPAGGARRAGDDRPDPGHHRPVPPPEAPRRLHPLHRRPAGDPALEVVPPALPARELLPPRVPPPLRGHRRGAATAPP